MNKGAEPFIGTHGSRFMDREIAGRPIPYWATMIGPWAGILLFAFFMGIVRPEWLGIGNIRNILVQASVFIVLATGMTFVITGGGIDLSVGAMTGMSALTLGWLIKFTDIPELLAIVLTFGMGLVLGSFNGILVTKLKLPDFIATLATWISYNGLVLVIIEGHTLFRFSPAVRFLGAHRIFGTIPVPIIAALLIALLGYFLMKWTKFGRYTIAIGGNRKASTEAGIPVERYKVYQYAFNGLLAALAGIMMLGRLNAIHGLVGQGFEIHTIAAVIIGGTALYGGIARIGGSVAGAIFLGLIANALTFLGIHFFVQYVVSGFVIMLVVLLYSLVGYQQQPPGVR